MSLTANMPDQNPETGSTGVKIKPITDGKKVVVVADEKSFFDSVWATLDDVGTKALNGVSSIASEIVQQEVNGIKTGPEAAQTREGDPFDQPGRTETRANVPFYQEYKKELMIGGGVIAAVAVFFLVKK
jgi:hypothetical protein